MSVKAGLSHTQVALQIAELLRDHLAHCTLLDSHVQVRSASELSKAKHDGPRSDIIYVHNQKDFADHTEVTTRVAHERLNNLALFKVLDQASSSNGDAGDVRYLLVPLIVMIGRDNNGELVSSKQPAASPKKKRKGRRAHTKKRRDDAPPVVSLHVLNRFLQRRKAYLTEELAVDAAAVHLILRYAKREAYAQKTRQELFISKGGSTTKNAANFAQKRCALVCCIGGPHDCE